MNHKIQEIDQILKEIAQIASQKPEFSHSNKRTDDIIYNYLIFRNVSEKDRGLDFTKSPNRFFKSVFEKWIQQNRRKNTKVFIDEEWKYFCQFLSKDEGAALHSREHLKVYVPLDGDHIEKGANLLFDFLDQNGISHASKIGKRVRFDDIVIRLVNKEDLSKLLNFIESNSYIQKGLLPSNPFAFQQNNIALVCDGSKSYNETVSSLISMYMVEKKRNNQLNQVGYMDFFQTVEKWYRGSFMKEGESPLAEKFHFTDGSKIAENYKEIISLMLKVQGSRFGMEDYLDHYDKAKKAKEEVRVIPPKPIPIMTLEEKEKRKEQLKALLFDQPERLREELNELEDTDEIDVTEIVEQASSNLDQTLLSAIETMQKKMDLESSLNGIGAFIHSGNARYITRLDHLRERLVNSYFREDMKRKLEESHQSFHEYAKKKLQENGISGNQMS